MGPNARPGDVVVELLERLENGCVWPESRKEPLVDQYLLVNQSAGDGPIFECFAEQPAPLSICVTRCRSAGRVWSGDEGEHRRDLSAAGGTGRLRLPFTARLGRYTVDRLGSL